MVNEIFFRPKDAPGQKSVYIPPGDTEKEAYRLSTFIRFTNAAVDPRLLAKFGFYYTGYKDRVKCFSCGGATDGWTPYDDVTSAEWHLRDCKIMLGEDSGNVPLSKLILLTIISISFTYYTIIWVKR